MADQFPTNPNSEAEPTMPHIPRVPSPDDYDPTKPGLLPGEVSARDESFFPTSSEPTMPHGMPPVQTPSNPYGAAYDPTDQDYYEQRVARDRDRKRRMRSRQRRSGEWAWVIIALALFGVTLVISMSVFVVLRSSRIANTTVTDTGGGLVSAQSTAVVLFPTAVGGGPGGAAIVAPNSTADMGIISNDEALAEINLEPWDGTERFTVLLMGWDRRPGDPPDAAYRTDTMMLVSIDPATNSIGVLSIPRDLYVNIPGYNQLQRVNSAYVLGELQQPGYGHDLTQQTVMLNLGIRVHDYLIADFNAFITVIDAIGGIDVDVPYNISDPQYPNMYYGYDPFYITAGEQHLDGATALKYARTRHGSSDFRRAERQQQVVFAIRDRVLSLGNLPQLILNAPQIWASIQEGVKTGLTLDQMMRLAWYVKDIPSANIHTGVIDEEYISFYTTPSGASVVVPNRYRLGPLMEEVFGPGYNE